MRTRAVVATLVLGAVAVVIGAAATALVFFGLAGAIGLAVGTVVVGGAYVLFVRRRITSWGATPGEVARTLPGDDIIPKAGSSTRAITVEAPPRDVWPWLVQLGYGRAGWYSYDWIDNDGRRSADWVVPELQRLDVGDEITMIPGMGPRVRDIVPERFLLSGDARAGTWCIWLEPVGDNATRLISRWRARWKVTPATLFWIAITEPGSFIMERKMLLGIKQRAERLAATHGSAAATRQSSRLWVESL